MCRIVLALFACVFFMAVPAAFADDDARLRSADHYVRVKSTAPAIAGQDALLYVREVVAADKTAPHGVVLFVHGAGTPANAMWEKHHLLLFKASLDWLRDGKVNGVSQGEFKLGN